MTLQSLPNRIYVFALVALCFVTRMPQLLSPILLLDGDECILGLMAKHLSEGKEIPVYFYGQNYGFSLLEAAFGGLGFLAFGVSAIMLRVSLLVLWSIGIVFLFLSFVQYTNKKNAFIIALLMILIPAWAIGSMKARGGYITAFTFTSILFYLIFKAKETPSLWASFGIGILTILIYYSRPFWIPGLIPILVYVYVLKRQFKTSLWLLSGAIIMLIIFLFLLPKPEAYWAPKLLFNSSFFKAVKDIPQRIFCNVTGSYELERNIPLGFFDRICSYFWDGILVALLILQTYRLAFKKYLIWSHVLCISVLMTLAYTPFFTENYGARYLLPYTQFLLLWMGVEMIDFGRYPLNKNFLHILVSMLCILGVGAMVEFKDFNYMNPINTNKSEQQRLDEVMKFLKQNGVQHVFSTDPLLQWQLAFYSKEEVVGRWLDAKDRYPAYPMAVGKALKEGKPIALLGYSEFMYGLDKLPEINQEIVYIGERYYIYLNPKKDFLLDRKFAILP